MKRLVLAIVACVTLTGCCGFLEPNIEQVKNELRELQPGIPRAKAEGILNDRWFYFQKYDQMIVGQRSYGECAAVKRFFRVSVVFDGENRVTDIHVEEVRIPL